MSELVTDSQKLLKPIYEAYNGHRIFSNPDALSTLLDLTGL